MREDLRMIDSFYEVVVCGTSLSGMPGSEWKIHGSELRAAYVRSVAPIQVPTFTCGEISMKRSVVALLTAAALSFQIVPAEAGDCGCPSGFKLPKLELPKMCMPKMNLPKLCLPKLDMPRLPKLDLCSMKPSCAAKCCSAKPSCAAPAACAPACASRAPSCAAPAACAPACAPKGPSCAAPASAPCPPGCAAPVAPYAPAAPTEAAPAPAPPAEVAPSAAAKSA